MKKETLSSKRKELKKVLGNSRPDLIKEIDFVLNLVRQQDREFIQKLKISLRDKYSDKKCLYETAIITGKVFEEIDKLAGEELTK